MYFRKIPRRKKWIKIIEGSSVWGFVGKADGVYKGISYKKGDVFKPASWNAPAKWARGSIFDENKEWYRFWNKKK